MSAESRSLAALGGKPLFASMRLPGQLNFPSWDAYETAFRDILARNWYTNHGPLAVKLEQQLAEMIGVGHAVCVTNATLGLSIAAEALGIDGPVVVPGLAVIGTAQALLWSNLEPVFCDVDRFTHHIDPFAVEQRLRDGARAILGVNLWGGLCDVQALEGLAAQYGVPLYFDSSHAFGGVAIGGGKAGTFGDAEVFSMHRDDVLNATEGGFIATDDGELAERMRNIRSSYGVRRAVAVGRTANGRMSEAQAAMALLSLESLPDTLERNDALYAAYRAGLADIPGLALVEPAYVARGNHSWSVCAVDETVFGLDGGMLCRALRKENIGAQPALVPGVLESPFFAEMVARSPDRLQTSRQLARTLIRLPLGAAVDTDDVNAICRKIIDIRSAASAVRQAVGDGA
jgi:dTDP-4-amino-4,6-dideoxygalactose transaminase